MEVHDADRPIRSATGSAVTAGSGAPGSSTRAPDPAVEGRCGRLTRRPTVHRPGHLAVHDPTNDTIHGIPMGRNAMFVVAIFPGRRGPPLRVRAADAITTGLARVEAQETRPIGFPDVIVTIGALAFRTFPVVHRVWAVERRLGDLERLHRERTPGVRHEHRWIRGSEPDTHQYDEHELDRDEL
ncbi:MAG: hypothetical protein JNL82_40345 [Myxococcales bacterium]|nr:hypothetical protein [Myxococcales bacterium]